MPLLALVIIGAAAGFIATRMMKLNSNVPTTIAIGIFGALIGGLVLRMLLTITGWAAGFVGAVLVDDNILVLPEFYGGVPG